MKSIKEIKLNNQSMDSTFLVQAAYTWKMLWVRLDWTYYCWNWKLKTENWKYCSKIIFKCVNSTMGPILNFFSAWTVLWTVMNSAWTVIFSPTQWTHVRLLFTHREKKNFENADAHPKHTLCMLVLQRHNFKIPLHLFQFTFHV